MKKIRKHIKHLGSTIILAVTTMIAAQPAAANIIEINNWWAGHGNVTFDFTGTNWHDGNTVAGFHEVTALGGFKTFDLTTDPGKTQAFQTWCADIFSSFTFVIKSNDTLKSANVALAGSTATSPTVFSTQAANDLGRLYTNHHSAIDSTSSTATNESAFQLAIWEIINERSGSYSLNAGDFTASGTGDSLANTWLTELSVPSVSLYNANIWVVQSIITSGHGVPQDLVVFSRVPEPGTYTLLLTGLGLIGWTMRRKKQRL